MYDLICQTFLYDRLRLPIMTYKAMGSIRVQLTFSQMQKVSEPVSKYILTQSNRWSNEYEHFFLLQNCMIMLKGFQSSYLFELTSSGGFGLRYQRFQSFGGVLCYSLVSAFYGFIAAVKLVLLRRPIAPKQIFATFKVQVPICLTKSSSFLFKLLFVPPVQTQSCQKRLIILSLFKQITSY